MPYVQHWEPAPKDPKLVVLKELPPGKVRERDWGVREAFVDGNPYHYCDCCKGWIEGSASEYAVNTLNPGMLSGKRGREFYCKRCGKEIEFIGARS